MSRLEALRALLAKSQAEHATETCWACDGTGFGSSWREWTCPRCKGRGKVEKVSHAGPA